MSIPLTDPFSTTPFRAIKPSASYVITLLRLDREFLRKLREARILRILWKDKLTNLRKRIEELLETLAVIETLLDGSRP